MALSQRAGLSQSRFSIRVDERPPIRVPRPQSMLRPIIELNGTPTAERTLFESRLAHLTDELKIEEQRKKRLEDELVRARVQAEARDPAIRALEERIVREKERLKLVEMEYANDLRHLAELRNQLDRARIARGLVNAKHSTHPSSRDQSTCVATGRVSEAPPIKITSAERVELETFLRDCGRFHAQGKLKARQRVELQTKVEEFERFLDEIQEGLGIGSIVELFEEAMRLERENTELLRAREVKEAERAALGQQICATEQRLRELEADRVAREGGELAELSQIDDEVRAVSAALATLKQKRSAEESAFENVFRILEKLFNCLQLSWDEATDGTTTVSAANVNWVLGQIEESLGEMSERRELPDCDYPTFDVDLGEAA